MLFMFMASYFATIFTPVPKIPEKYYLPEDVFKDYVGEKTERGRNAILYRYIAQANIVVLNVSGSGECFSFEL